MASRAEATQDRVNARVYHAAGVDSVYQSALLTRVETVVLLKYHDAFVGRDVLDIGVGTGRTVPYLMPLARRYAGIDYSPVMVASSRRKLPGAPVQQADMRCLSPFPDGSMDFIFAPNNVLDAVGEADRRRTLAEFRRVLRSGGVVAFSSHNRHRAGVLHGPRLRWSRNPVTQAMLLAQWLRQLAHHARVSPLREVHEEHALLNDVGHDYACLHFYASQAYERQQLAEAGFELLEVFDNDGRCVAPEDPAVHSSALTYVCSRTD